MWFKQVSDRYSFGFQNCRLFLKMSALLVAQRGRTPQDSFGLGRGRSSDLWFAHFFAGACLIRLQHSMQLLRSGSPSPTAVYGSESKTLAL